ncbi:MAG: flagellar hook-associated protein FlgL [Rhodoferax sp.]|jgi:flagellar hook-associated protein 3 FlgL|nr:flagellar hook-associated protein FlgL [Rhodoferax sp.]MBP9929099.1 flagellar hook-associated protein FlgL [Rhodoferax sp.]HQX58733.1 flagellar hook-associated protein FlgL [Burkholderiaceae bacterium]HQZ06137.1 flagellar hook-associated protein FlgL [Burkholderiaceae bacterium]HRA61036.1 flagellar hook-associated protein FlgL [Burkholderiaceae bacterium]
MRIGTANVYETSLEQLYKRQNEMLTQQEQLSSGLRVNRASDDPIAAAQAERAMVRLNRIDTDQRALETQRSALSSAEAGLGEALGRMQDLRELVVAAGNAAFSPADRNTLAKQISSLRDQIFAIANRTDSNGVPLFGGLGSAGAPFADIPAGVLFQGASGQRAATTTALPGAMNGQAIWMDVPSGNRTFEVSLGAGNSGGVWTDTGHVVSPALLTGQDYRIDFTVSAGVTTYDVVNTTTSATVLSAQPYTSGAPIQFDGLSVLPQGAPANGDTVVIAPSTALNLFNLLDGTINSIDNAASDNKLSQAIALSLAQIDTGMERLQSARGQAGDWLNRADSITDAQSARSLALESDRSRAVDADMAKAISNFTVAQTGYQAALQSYAQIQRLSLFNYIN